jgi:hypothetical protein
MFSKRGHPRPVKNVLNKGYGVLGILKPLVAKIPSMRRDPGALNKCPL